MKYIQNGILRVTKDNWGNQVENEIYTEWNFEVICQKMMPDMINMKYIQNGILRDKNDFFENPPSHEIYTEWNFEKDPSEKAIKQSNEIYTEWNFE